eukprot:2121258-Alexandrium_andersonii.AAC.1
MSSGYGRIPLARRPVRPGSAADRGAEAAIKSRERCGAATLQSKRLRARRPVGGHRASARAGAWP